jgi:hypothetical protein
VSALLNINGEWRRSLAARVLNTSVFDIGGQAPHDHLEPQSEALVGATREEFIDRLVDVRELLAWQGFEVSPDQLKDLLGGRGSPVGDCGFIASSRA